MAYAKINSKVNLNAADEGLETCYFHNEDVEIVSSRVRQKLNESNVFPGDKDHNGNIYVCGFMIKKVEYISGGNKIPGFALVGVAKVDSDGIPIVVLDGSNLALNEEPHVMGISCPPQTDSHGGKEVFIDE